MLSNHHKDHCMDVPEYLSICIGHVSYALRVLCIKEAGVL
jgi:hypothetical protein